MDHNTFADINGKGMRFAIVRARFNPEVTRGLLNGALRTLYAAGVKEDDVKVVEVPGSYEIIHAANMLGHWREYDAIIALGCIMKGETHHDEYLATAVYNGLNQVILDHRLPVVVGIITANTPEQAQVRSGDGDMNRGAEAAKAALEMVSLKLVCNCEE